MAAIDDFPMADYHFIRVGLQYYAGGRFAAITALIPVAGNLLHHALEMLLKARLAHSYSLDDLKDRKLFSHDLARCWTAFKAVYPNEDLSPFDDLVSKLHGFETLRYPDNLLKQGAHIAMGFQSGNLVAGHSPIPGQPVYQLSITDLDALMDRIFRICGINPEAYIGAFNQAAEFLVKNNVSCKGWFPDREKAGLT